MRKISTQSGSRVCEFPNTVHFANVPAIVRVYWDPLLGDYVPDVVTIQLSDVDARMYTEYRAVFNNEVVFDIRRFMQTAFVDLGIDVVNYSGGMWIVNPNYHSVDAVVSYKDANNNTVIAASFTVDAVFGNIERGESTGGNIRRRWFINYPFTLDFYVKKGDEFNLIVDGEDRPGVNFATDELPSSAPLRASGYFRRLLNVKKLIDPFTIDKNFRLSQPFGYVTKNDVESAGIVTYDVDIDRTPADCKKGVYLRWIDNLGRFCYWLFKDLGTSDAVVGSSYISADIVNPIIYNSGVNAGTDVRQSFSRTKTRNLGAKSIDAELFEFLLTLVSSPFVDMFDGYDANDVPQWHRVNVAPGTVARSTKPRQDFTVAIVEPTQITQSL